MRSIRTNNGFYIKSYSKTVRDYGIDDPLSDCGSEIKHTTIGEKPSSSNMAECSSIQ